MSNTLRLIACCALLPLSASAQAPADKPRVFEGALVGNPNAKLPGMNLSGPNKSTNGKIKARLTGNKLEVEGAFSSFHSNGDKVHLYVGTNPDVTHEHTAEEAICELAFKSKLVHNPSFSKLGECSLNEAQLTALQEGRIYADIHLVDRPQAFVRGPIVSPGTQPAMPVVVPQPQADKSQAFEGALVGNPNAKLPGMNLSGPTKFTNGKIKARLTGNKLEVEGAFSSFHSNGDKVHLYVATNPDVTHEHTAEEAICELAFKSKLVHNPSFSKLGECSLNEAQLTALQEGKIYADIHLVDRPQAFVRGPITLKK